ncbi:MAG TPA: hypothetical protein DCE44_15615 [Verrucomicrobiales bacterium]|nr:hypothetical protein [Verrucomicrobiales bacterium]
MARRKVWSKLEPAANPISLPAVKKVLVLLVVALMAGAAASGCKSSGSREFIPGRGWVPTD